MFRWVFVALLLVFASACQARAQAPTPAAAKQAFEQLQQQWVDSIVQMRKLSQERDAAGKGHSELDHQIEELRKQVEEMVDKIVAAGLDVHRAGVADDATVNSTLVAIAGFYVTGDAEGDGGDQYEKALPLIKSMLSAGLGDASKELWLWGGVAAFNLNDFSLAEEYFNKARAAGMLGSTPPGQGPGDPLNRVWQLADSQSKSLSATRQAWQKEQQIRAQEATADNLPRVKFRTTRGDIVIELFENEAPQATANILSLVKSGYYDGLTFHRVLPAFMAQGGDNQRGGPGYTIRCECYQPGYRKHFRGSLSMAKPSNPPRDSGSAQFFLTFVPTSYLDGKHTVFGRVVEGMDVAAALKRRDPASPGPWPEPDKIVKALVLRDRGHEYTFEKLPER